MILRKLLSDLLLAIDNLRAQKTRTLLTALGIVFGVGSVIGMLAIGAGAREESLRFIEQLGVRNILIDSRPATSREELQQRRRSSPGLTERDVRILEANIEDLEMLSPRRTLHPARILPKPARDIPELYGVRPSYASIHNLRVVEGRFFDQDHDAGSASVCVLGENAKVSLLGYQPAVGKFVKINDNWLEVVGVLGPNVAAGAQNTGGKMLDLNNIVYIPLNTFQYRYWDNSSFMRDDLDGIDLRLKAGADSIEVAKVVTAIVNSTHHDTPDFTVTIPAALLAQQQRTQTIFTYVMVAISAISLLVGGIGIMNIVLATVLERTREIGIRRAIGARRPDIVRQFLTESVLISMAGGLLGIAFGFLLSWIIAKTAEWKTIVTAMSVFVAFGVSVTVGMIFGIYPPSRPRTSIPSKPCVTNRPRPPRLRPPQLWVAADDGTMRAAMAEGVIVANPEIMSGTPCFRGTRVPFKNLIDYLEGGHSLDEFLRQFPAVTCGMAVRALEEAKESLLARIR